MSRKICVVITARPTYSRVRSVLQAVKANPSVQLQLVVAASALLDRFGNTARYIEEDGFEISAKVHMVVEGGTPLTMAKTTGLGFIELASTFDNLRPDMVVTIADRFETLATAATAAYMNIPLAHIQGGEVTGSIDEKVRHAITKLSDIHFVATAKAAERLIQMGERKESVFVTGCPSLDLAAEIFRDQNRLEDSYAKYGGVGSAPDLTKDYMVVVQHPVTTEYQSARGHILETLYAVKDLTLPTLWFWPNMDAGSDGTTDGIRTFREREHPSNFHFFKSMAPLDFLRLISQSRCVIGNSSVGIRECDFLGVPAVNIGSRQQGRERGANVIDVGHDRKMIIQAVRTHLGNGKVSRGTVYGDGNSGMRIAQLLAQVPLSIEKRFPL